VTTSTFTHVGFVATLSNTAGCITRLPVPVFQARNSK